MLRKYHRQTPTGRGSDGEVRRKELALVIEEPQGPALSERKTGVKTQTRAKG